MNNKENEEFDVIVIGSGPGGAALANGLKAQGKKVALVERDKWGGTCPNYGCDPTKILMSAVETLRRAKAMQAAGVKGELSLDWAGMLERKLAFTEPFPERMRSGLDSSGISLLYGQASFLPDEQGLQVGDGVYQANNYVIATGQTARPLEIEGKAYLHDSNDFLALPELPKRVVFLGTGFVALELAQIAQASGAEVTLIARHSVQVKGFDEEISSDFIEQLKKEGLNFVENVDVQKVERFGESYCLSDGKGFELETDYLVAAVGRVPAVSGLGLENSGVELARDGIVVNEFLQTSQPNIYALGDVISKKGGKLTPVAGFEARYLVENWEKAERQGIRYPAFPLIVYGASKLATVGDVSGKAKELDMSSWYTYRRVADPIAKIKLYHDETGLIVGASILSTLADELVNHLAFLINQKISLEECQKSIMAYPTVASDLQYFY